MARKKSLLRKQVLTILLCTVLPIFLCMFIINAIEIQTLRKQIYMTSQDALSTNLRVFDSELQNAALSVASLDYNEDRVSMFQSRDITEQYYAQNEYLSRLAKISSSLITGYGVYCPENGNLIYDFRENASVGYPHRQAFIQLVRSTPEVLMNSNWHAVSSDGKWYLVYGYQIRESWFFCWTEMDFLMNLTKSWLTTQDGGIILLSGEGEEMIREEVLPELPLPSEKGYILSGRYLIFGQTSDTGAYRIIEAVSVSELTSRIKWFWIAAIFLLLLFLGNLPLLLHSLNRQIFAPMDQIQYAITRVNKGILDYRIPDDSTSVEFHNLTDSFNGMVSQIKNLKVQAYEDEIEKNKIRMQYMQVQIEPHFYLNALNTINAMAQVGDDELIQSLTRSLSDYMRFIASSRETVMISEELHHIDNYLAIMKIRRGDSFVYRLEYTQELQSFLIPPLLIQTLIENIMKYAFNAYGETEIHVAIRRRLLAGKDGVEIIVMDNGNGYPEEYIAQFNGGVYEDTRRIGLQNARMRLRYLYGDAIIFRIGNRLEGGARTYIWIPNAAKEKRNEHTDRG